MYDPGLPDLPDMMHRMGNIMADGVTNLCSAVLMNQSPVHRPYPGLKKAAGSPGQRLFFLFRLLD